MSDIDDESISFIDEKERSDDSFVVPDDDDLASPRPAKRRRLEKTGSGSDEDHPAGSTPSVDLPSSPGADAWNQAGGKPGSKSFKTAARNNIQEDTFVTQLTQPPSSPERIRGPRWKKPDPPTPRIDREPTESREDDNDEFDNDEDLKAALAASLDSFQEETSRDFDKVASRDFAQDLGQQERQGNGPRPEPVDSTLDIGDIPEDAFDSSPSLSPPSRPAQVQANNVTPVASRSGNFRQTTLFDMAGKSSQRTPQQNTQETSAVGKDEPATQHKLDRESLQTWVYPTNLGKIRDYQFNITQKGLFHNLLVALPTGLGKTFIAATIMLNWYRWTKDAQIIFVAPTKPLVAQQISACFGIAGIPRSKTTMLTGEAAPGIRAEEWQEKRVFFMTPQTVLNDLKTGIADPKRIVLLVIDEAHRATGGYAYVELVKFLRRFNRSFRVLGLTATPGSTVESVQGVIDGLDIARVEIRTEQSLDIREYVHSRNTEVETFENSEEINLCLELFSAALQPHVDELRTLNAFWGRDPALLTPYGLTKARQQWMGSDAGRNASFGLKGKVNAIFTLLASLAHGIDLLKYHGITPFYRHLQHFQTNGGKGKYQREIINDDNYKKLMSHLEPWTKDPEFIGHPKLEYLKQVVLNHFMDAGEGLADGDQPGPSRTRIMIFVHFRDSAEEVTKVLKRYEPMIRPHVFVGQTGAKGSEGMDQKKQISVVDQFKKGVYNTIVATSIGEEGLDIGEVDLIVCYDSSASPVRMLQRMGRTGRKRTGNIVLLLMKGKEEDNYIKAKDNYEKMQQIIASGSQFTFHDDRSPRILPPDVKPVVDKRNVEIPEENAQSTDLPEPRRRGRAPKRPPKKFHMPDDVETGFTKASRLAGSNNNNNNNTSKGSKGKSTTTKSSKRSTRRPTPEPVEVPGLEEVLLTPAQQRELEVQYQTVAVPQTVSVPRVDAFPRLQLDPRPTKFVQHGSLTRRLVDTLRKMDETGEDCDRRYRQVLAREEASLANKTHLTHQRNRGKRKAEASTVSPKLKPGGSDDDDDIQVLSPQALFQSSGTGRQESPEPRPFYTPRWNHDANKIDTIDELPDISALFE